jgi:hypothetical protein
MKPSIEILRIGAEQTPIAIVDNFLADPDGLCRVATEAEFKPLGDYYPGVRCHVPQDYFAATLPVVVPTLKRIFGFSQSARYIRGLFSLATTHSDDLALAQRVPHIDGTEPGLIAVVHYLFKDDLGGTAFYRQRATGFERIDAARHQTFLNALEMDFDRYGKPPPAYIASDSPAFEQICAVEARYNRAVIYPGNQLHCAILPNGKVLEADPAKGRLTVASFLMAE